MTSASASLPARPGSCTSATRARRSSTGCSRTARTARSSCASRTPTPSARRASPRRASSRTCAGSGSTGTRGPTSAAPHGPYRQSERLHLYASYANELLAGGHAYYCFCSPAKLEADRQDDLRRGPAAEVSRHLPRPAARTRRARASTPASGRSIRFQVPEHVEVSFQDLVRGEVTFSTDVIGDPVLVRSDGRPAYNFAVVVDDALMEITHVIRGEDHISNTPRQVLLYQALGFTPPEFAHLSLVLGPDHTPLSKRHGATSVAEFRARGYLPEALVNYLALIGWSPGGRRRGAAADRRAGAPLRARGRRPQRRRVRPREAGVDEPPLHEGGGAGAAGGRVGARTSWRAAT